ncbi:NAD-glutamate dehydrogenase [Rhodococcus sp. Leaf7]|uniref:NAD-glutamate dehydrogenase n=1 Tax=unclassified Rhodococcus (in: high G+C Gram-positive bacteria) TaxID=192944 RepID=UPI0006F74B5B|nr:MULTISPECIES: NAD-glutamate dehydrogenase [unclassified Rhodococcus (in: high G+C Gram-positive bacteria)]KQU02456.1 NAD-glutamate dehydrogenase [Rhodococcus sp. Leaf7]KQU37927.1 NAD-glutamate dehydrogenase [Rhodococcus sp. Leaf247]
MTSTGGHSDSATAPSSVLERADDLRAVYFGHVDLDVLRATTGADPAEVVTRHLALAQDRTTGVANIELHRGPDSAVGVAIQIVTDDMPMLVESVTAWLTNLGIAVVEVVHPILRVVRDDSGHLLSIRGGATPADVDTGDAADGSILESWIHVALHPAASEDSFASLESSLEDVLGDVRRVVDDTPAMQRRQLELADRLDRPRRGDADDSETVTPQARHDAGRLLRWLAEGNFRVLGSRRYTATESGLEPVMESGLGILRSDDAGVVEGFDLPIDRVVAREDLLVLTRASSSTSVHRAVHPYFVGVHDLDDEGNTVGENRFTGLFTIAALHGNVLDIPVVGDRVRAVIEKAGHTLTSYSGQAMLESIQSFPRTELFSADARSLFDTISAVERSALRREVLLFLRRDGYGRFVSALVYLPRDSYTTRLRLETRRILLEELGGIDVEYEARVTDSPLALVHFTVRFDGQSADAVDVSDANRDRIRALIADATRTWDDALRVAAASDPAVSPDSAARYAVAFPEAYKQDFDPARALIDIGRLDALVDDRIDMCLYRPQDAERGQWRFSLYVTGHEVSLSQVLPVLQSLGVEVVDERPYAVVRLDGTRCWIYDFGLSAEPEVIEGATTDAGVVGRRFTDSFAAVWRGHAEADRFNELVLRAGLEWRRVVVLRAYAKYLRQAAFPYSQAGIEYVLLDNPVTASLLADLFDAQFDPDSSSEDRAREIADELTTVIDRVVSLDADRVLRAMFTLVRATLRTNHFVVDAEGRGRDFLSLKFDPRNIDALPKPRPRFEIFVYSPRVEGVHLRFGAVARGGLRWSDRREDFRTEVLGLAKAQAVKNAVIVPVGAKGGFVVKRPPTPTGDPATDRANTGAEGRACYRMFIAGLLDVTDNLNRATRAAIPPARVVRRDDDDSYLVVAADKGTATFSDLANEVSAEYDFWLGDAFASGGSIGYDHKAMGITAKGAWESVKRHFREFGVDTQRDEITVVGIGDMSGDVFGNGMLLSEHLRIVAAFDHRHIFLDPAPVASTSFAERRRLFELPRSSWADYDTSLISDGGGVWDRTVKSVPISAQARSALGLADDVTALSPPELMRAILTAPVDLLWNGGIGTYIKSRTESDSDVGDKANDPVRINGSDIRARVVGEGGNLGATALGRIEYSAAGGKINTDAVDNSAGVDCSDHEVNIKILLDSTVSSGDLPAHEREELLASMTDEVGLLVLEDNVAQNEVLGVSRAHAPELLGVHARLIAELVASGRVDRTIDALPTKSEIARRGKEGLGLTSPELATLMAHVKLALQEDLLASDVPDSEVFAPLVTEYFPTPLRERFAGAIKAHPLRQEIVATRIANETVDHGGISYAFRLAEDSGVGSTDAARAFAATSEIFGLHEIWCIIATTDMPTAASDELVLESRRLLDRGSRWLLSNRPQPIAVGAEITRFARKVRDLEAELPSWLKGRQASSGIDRAAVAIEKGAPEALAHRVFRLLDVFCLLDVIETADIADQDDAAMASLYYALSEHLGIDWLLSAVSTLERGDRWHSLARLALRDDLYSSLRALTLDVIGGGEPGETPEEMIAEWESTNASRLSRARAALTEIGESGTLDLATLSVAARQIRSMVRGAGARTDVSR